MNSTLAAPAGTRRGQRLRGADGPAWLGPMRKGINESSVPSGPGCVECTAAGGWWVHLRRCAECGHIGCCDSSPSQHATAHWTSTGHPVITTFEPGEDWFWDYQEGKGFLGPRLPDPQAHPLDQPAPGPAGAVPPDWRDRLRG